MRAAAFRTPGPPSVIEIVDVETPAAGPEECRIDVTATALNRSDLLRRSGAIGVSDDLTVLGLEFSGVVAEVGGAVRDFAPGDAVIGRVPSGAYAEALVTHERLLMPAPRAVPLADAASIPLAWMTAYDALVTRGRLRPAETVLIHAGASGVGTAAIQLARAFHATVLTTTSHAKTVACEAIGAQYVIARDRDEFAQRVRDLTGGQGCDIVLDVVGRPYLRQNIDVLAAGGRVVVAGLLESSGEASIPLEQFLAKRAELLVTNLGAGRFEDRAILTRQLAREVLPLFENGTIRPVIDRRFSLEEIPEAHAYLESNRNVGKVIIDVKTE